MTLVEKGSAILHFKLWGDWPALSFGSQPFRAQCRPDTACSVSALCATLTAVCSPKIRWILTLLCRRIKKRSGVDKKAREPWHSHSVGPGSPHRARPPWGPQTQTDGTFATIKLMTWILTLLRRRIITFRTLGSFSLAYGTRNIHRARGITLLSSAALARRRPQRRHLQNIRCKHPSQFKLVQQPARGIADPLAAGHGFLAHQSFFCIKKCSGDWRMGSQH